MDTPSEKKPRLIKMTLLWFIVPAILILFLVNTSFLASPQQQGFMFAHRALGQDFSREGLTGATCTAARMLPSGHSHLENSLPAMKAAFDYGADFVELDVHLTRDDTFAVFHDWTLDCRTDGSGVTREQTMPLLRSLDIGYGYTPDNGNTWPFRGKGVGMMPSLQQVLTTFPNQNFVIDFKGNDANEGIQLAQLISNLEGTYAGELILTGGPKAVSKTQEQHPQLKAVTRPQLKQCFIGYLSLGWLGYVPSDCKNSLITVPANIAPLLWGWPNRFIRRMEKAGSYVTLIGPYNGEGFSQGFNTLELVNKLPNNYQGGIWTDRIDLIAPAIEQ